MPPDRQDRTNDHPCQAGPRSGDGASGVSRRSFIQTVGISSAAVALRTHTEARAQDDAAATDTTIIGPGPINVSLKVNGKPVNTTVEPDATLLDLLRLDLNLTGPKEICGRGSCGGCSVILDGKLVCSCLTLAADAQDTAVTTIEGLADGDRLDPVQESFIRHDALQCGYCTPGCIMASRALLDENPKPNLDEIKQGLSGNYCRCAAYVNMYNAVLDASGQPPIRDGKGA